MRDTGLFRALRRPQPVLALILSVAGAMAVPAGSSATVLAPWGSNLTATPNYDLANGDYTPYAGNGFSDSNPARGSRDAVVYPGNSADPSYHGGDDAAVWNRGDTAPAGGQVLEVKVKGCAWNDGSAPGFPSNELSAGYPVNWVNFQALAPAGGGSYVPTATATGFAIPFCSNPSSPTTGPVNTSTISTFQPLHLCVAQGDAVDLADVGGFIPASGSYPNGVPFLVLAGPGSATAGSALDSYVHVTQSNGSFAPSSGNFGSEPNEELMLQVIEGVGANAYGLCPDGVANEPLDSNTVICVYTETSPGGPYGTCNAQGLPVYAPTSRAAPAVSGTAAVGQRLDESHGAWTNNPYGYKLQWERCDLGGANCNAIAGANDGWYYPTGSDLGTTLRVEEWAVNDANTEGPAISAPTGVVTGGSGAASSNRVQVRLGQLRVNPATFRASKSTVVTYTDSRIATTTLRVFRLKPGVLRGRACDAPTKRVHSRLVKCTRMIRERTLVHRDRAGANRIKLGGLSPGKYEVEAIVTLGPSRSLAVARFKVRP